MTSPNVFIEHRVNSLAAVYLTRRQDLEIIPMAAGNLDLLVRVTSEVEGLANSFLSFGCVLHGTSVPLPTTTAANKHLQSWRRNQPRPQFFFPVLVLLFSMEDDVGYYAWNSEPLVEREKPPQLVQVDSLDCMRLERRSLNAIVDKVIRWYQQLADFLIVKE